MLPQQFRRRTTCTQEAPGAGEGIRGRLQPLPRSQDQARSQVPLVGPARAGCPPPQTFPTPREVEYFTARVRNQPESEQRQTTYLDALTAHSPLVKVVQGRFQEKTHECWSCGGRWVSYEEKETAVSIAVQLVEDAVQGVFDTALLISADSDLCPAVRSLKRQPRQACHRRVPAPQTQRGPAESGRRHDQDQ
ncbi:MAG: NYN domain-containing protein [Pseudonocardiaceae bacterium]